MSPPAGQQQETLLQGAVSRKDQAFTRASVCIVFYRGLKGESEFMSLGGPPSGCFGLLMVLEES